MPHLDSGAYTVLAIGLLAVVGFVWLLLAVRHEPHGRFTSRPSHDHSRRAA